MKRPHPKAYTFAISLTLLAPTAAVAQQPLRLSLPDRYLAADSPNSSQKTQNGKDDVQDKRTAPMPVWLAAGVASFASIALLSGTKGQKHKPGSGDHSPDPGAGQGGAAPSNGAGVIVGLADSGVQIEHPRLAGRVASTFNAFNGSNDASDHMGHGTSVAGIVSNIAPGSLIHIAKVFQNGASPSEVVSRGVGWLASTNAQILSLSLGSDAPVAERSLRAAVNNGKLVVAAMGNNSQSHARWPAKFAGEGWAKGQIIAVGALDPAGNRANFSNWDPALAHFTVFAPGVNIQTAGLNGTTVSFSGTSAATPAVAAQAARIQGTWNFLKAREVAEIIFLTADRICSDAPAGPVCAGRGPDPVYGWGRANIQRSLKPVGKLRVVDESGQNAELAGSMLRAANPGVFAALSQVSTVAVDDFHRGFHTNVLGSPMSRSKALPELPANRSKDEAAKTELYFGAAAHAVSVEFGQILTDRFSVNLGSGPAQDAFFGLESTGYAPLGLSGIESRFNAPYLALASAGTHMGAKYAFNSTSSLRFGVLSQSSKPTLNPQNKDHAARTVVIAELEHTKGNEENKLAAVATLGRVLDSNGVLGLSGTGVFATEGSSDSEFLSLAATKAIGQGMSVAAMLSYGRSSAFENTSFSLFKGASSVSSAAWTVGVARSNLRASGDRLGLTVSMPLRAMSGYISLDGASSQNQADGSLNFERRVVRLAPSGRERRIELAYATPVRGGHLSVQANVRLQPGHLADARPDAGLGARLQLAW